MNIESRLLKSICHKIDYGLTASATNVETGVKFLRITDIQEDKVDWGQVPFCECSEQDLEKYRLEAGDIVFARTGATTGKSYLIQKTPDNSVFASYLIRAKPDKSKLDPRYLAYYFRTKEYWNLISDSSVGAAQVGFNGSKLAGLRIPLPPLAEQQRIADILSRADRLRRLRRFALEMSEGYLQAVFLEMFGDPVTNPMGWELVTIGSQIRDIRYGTGSPPPYEENGIPFIRATNIKGGTIEFAGMAYISEKSAKAIEKCRVSDGDLLVVRSGVNTGDCAVIPSYLDGAFAAYDLIIRVDYPLNHYYNSLINSRFGKAIIEPMSRRSGQPHLNAEQVRSMRFPVPPKDYIDKFARIVGNVDRLRAQQREALRQAEHLFQGLLQAAFRGEV